MIVTKAVRMAEMMDVPVLGLVESMAYLLCPNCGTKHYPFGPSPSQATAARHGLEALGTLPLDPALAAACDAGRIKAFSTEELDPVCRYLQDLR